MTSYFKNIKNRQIWKSFVAYPAAAFVILQAVDFFIIKYNLNAKTLTLSLILLIGGFIISVIWNWNHGKEGVQIFTNKEKTTYAIVGFLTCISAGYYWINTETPIENEIANNSDIFHKLAVLPFENKSTDSSLVYLSDGIPENLINRLSVITNLKVLSRNSTFILDESERNSTQVNKKLGADLLLTGRVEKLNNRLVINCQLINILEGIQIWGEKLFYDDENIIELEENIVASLLNKLPNSIKRKDYKTENNAVINPEAKAHFMKGRALSYGSTKEEAEKALQHFREAIEIDPKFTPAYVAIANEKTIQAMFSTATRDEIFNEARLAVQTAMALDPNSAEAYYVDGAIKFYGDFDWEGAEQSYKKSIELNPNNANAYIRYSAFLGAMKRHEESLIMADKAIALDPISISSLHNLGWVNLIAGNFKASEAAFSEALDLHPNWTWGYIKRGFARIYQDKCDLALADTAKAREILDGWGSELIEQTFITINDYCGNQEKKKELVTRYLNHFTPKNYTSAYSMGSVYFRNGEIDKALYWIEKSIKEKEANCYLYNMDIFTEDLLKIQRFKEIIKDMKFPK